MHIAKAGIVKAQVARIWSKRVRNKVNLILSKGDYCSKAAIGSMVRNGHTVQPYWQKLDRDPEMAKLAHRAQYTSKLESEDIFLFYNLRRTSHRNKN